MLGVMGALALRLLGGITASIDGEAVDLRSRKASALLAYLALSPERCCSRERLAHLLWGDMRDDRARHNLRQTISLLRAALGGELITNDAASQTVTLAIATDQVDALAITERARSDDPDDLRAVISALEKRELLGSLSLREAPFDEWLTQQRARFHDLASSAFDKLTQRLAEQRESQDAIDVARRWIEFDPLCEHAHRLLMRLLDGDGQRSSALRQYDLCVRALADGLDVEPEPATQQLYAELRAQPAAPRPSQTLPLPLPNKPSAAVLPFENLDPDPTRRYFSDGMTEDIITALSQFHTLFVVSRSSSFAYRGRRVGAQEIGRELGVRYLVEGSVRVAGERLRVTADLVEAETQKQIWSHHYDRNLADLFEVQDELVQSIVATVADRVEADSMARARRKPTTSMVAYDYVLRGIELHRRCTSESTQQALEMFEKALDLDDEYALAHAWIACSIGQRFALSKGPDGDIVDSGLDDPDEMHRQLDRVYDALQRSRALDEDESECHRLLGAIQLSRGNFGEARTHIERAYRLNPNNDLILSLRGELATYVGDAADGVSWIRRAMRANPYHGDSLWDYLARALYHVEDYEGAIDALTRIKKQPRQWALMAASAARAGRADDAARYLAKAGETSAEKLAGGLPYERGEDLDFLVEGLRLAGCA
jgi:TolB-like protein